MRSLTAGHIAISRRMAGLSKLFPHGRHAIKLLYRTMPCGVSVAMALGRNILALTEASVKLSHLMFRVGSGSISRPAHLARWSRMSTCRSLMVIDSEEKQPSRPMAASLQHR
jgi:hypothetical protein